MIYMKNSICCATLNFYYETKTAYVQSLGDYGNCVFCPLIKFFVKQKFLRGSESPQKNVNFKVGQVLLLMIFSLCEEKSNIKKIELTDISKFNCLNTYNKLSNEYVINSKTKLHDNFDLMIISTLMKGKPYYSKYGFEPKYKEDKEILEHNIQIYNKKIKLKNINLMEFVLNNKNNIVNKNTNIEEYNKILDTIVIPEIKKFQNNPVSEFVFTILNVNPKNINDKIMLCNIILSFYKYLFNKMNYCEFKKKFLLNNYKKVILFLI